MINVYINYIFEYLILKKRTRVRRNNDKFTGRKMRHEHSQKFANCPSDHHWQFEPHIFPPLVQYFSACKVPPETVNYGSIQPADLPKCSQPCSLCLCHHKSLRYIVAKDFNFPEMLQKSQTITWDASKTIMNIGRYLLLQDFFHQMA